MAITPGYGGTLTFGGTTMACKNIRISRSRTSVETTLLSDYREKRAPGRYRRSGTLDLHKSGSTTDNALLAHLEPSSLANTIAASLALVFTDASSIATTMTIHVTDAQESHDGVNAMWTLSFEEQ